MWQSFALFLVLVGGDNRESPDKIGGKLRALPFSLLNDPFKKLVGCGHKGFLHHNTQPIDFDRGKCSDPMIKLVLVFSKNNELALLFLRPMRFHVIFGIDMPHLCRTMTETAMPLLIIHLVLHLSKPKFLMLFKIQFWHCADQIVESI